MTNNDLYGKGIWYYPLNQLEPPENLIIQIINNKVHLSWNPVQDATSYKIFSSGNPDSSFEEDFSGAFNGTSWNCSITENKKFFYVRAFR